MNVKFVVCIAFVVSITNLPRHTEQSLPKCGEVNAKKFPACFREGFKSTVVSLTNEYYARSYADIINNITVKLDNCSKYTSFILCSLYVPRCEENMEGPLLPCQDVCWEFVHDCGKKMDFTGLNWLKSLCRVLYNKTASPKCLKPPGFNSSNPISTQGLHCNEKVLNKTCVDAGCKDTFVPSKTQGNKTFIDNEIKTMDKMISSGVKSDKCKKILTKLACASYTPPCSKDGNKRKTLCRSECVDLIDDCPEAFSVSEVASYCAEPAEGHSDSGFCELTRWPSARHWDGGSQTTTNLPSSFPAGLIAALVLVPLFAIIFIYLAVAVRRRYEQRKSGYTQQRSTYTEPDNPTA